MHLSGISYNKKKTTLSTSPHQREHKSKTVPFTTEANYSVYATYFNI